MRTHCKLHFPPNSKVWGSLLEKGTRWAGWVARGSELGARRTGSVARGSELGARRPDGGSWGRGRRVAEMRSEGWRARAPGPGPTQRHKKTDSAVPDTESAGRAPMKRAAGPDAESAGEGLDTESTDAGGRDRDPTQRVAGECRGPDTDPDTESEIAPGPDADSHRGAGARRREQQCRGAPAGARHRGSTQRAPAPDTERAVPRHRERRGLTQRARVPEPNTESAGPDTESGGRAPGPNTD